jgi:CRP/FNR family transcriptional regulator, cyclic AMP receptor protein
LLANCFLFRGLVAGERDAIVARANMRHFAPGQTIFLMGSPGTSMMAVLDGKVRISVSSPQGREIVLAILEAGEVFGELAVLDGRDRTAHARAITACDLAMLERRHVMEFLERQPDAWPRIVNVLCQRVRGTNHHIGEITIQDLPMRVARVLLRISQTQKSRPAVPASVATVDVSQRDLADMVGAARESVNKCLRKWQRASLVRVEGTSIAIVDATGLKRISEDRQGPM